MPFNPPKTTIRGHMKYHGDILSQVDQSILDVSNIYQQVHHENLDPRWHISESPFLHDTGTMRRATSHEQIPRRKIPRIKLPPISNSDLEQTNKNRKRRINRFAQSYADKGTLYKSLLSTSLPDLPSLSKPKGKPYKFEKLSYSKRIQDGMQPAPANNQHAVAPTPASNIMYKIPPIQVQVSHRVSPSKQKISRKSHDKFAPETDVFQIINTMNRTVEYYEHDGNVYVSDNNQSWKEDCACQLCHRNKKEYFDSKRKIEERRLRKMKNSMNMRDQHASPVKELKEE